MRIKYFDIARFYLIVSIFIFPLASFWPGPSLVLITDVLISIVVLDILIRKRFSYDMRWIIILITLFLFQMFLIMAQDNWNIVLFLQSRSLFMYMVIIFFYMYTFSNLDSYNLKKMVHFIEVCIKILIGVILADGIAINFLDMETLLTNVFQSSIGNYGGGGFGVVFPKIPNGLIFGSQHASILSVVGIIWWLPGIKKIDTKDLSQYLWLILSIIALVFSSTITAMLTLIIALLVILSIILLRAIIKSISNYQIRAYQIIRLAFILLVPLTIITIGIFKEKIPIFLKTIVLMPFHLQHKEEDMLQYGDSIELKIDRYYAKMVEQPMDAFTNYFSDVLIGVGNSSQGLDIIAEIGLIYLSVHYGLIFVGILILLYSFYMFKVIYFIIRNNVKNEENNIIFRLLLVNLVIVLSLMHYTTFLVHGIKQFFAAVIALLFVFLKNEYLKKHSYYPGK